MAKHDPAHVGLGGSSAQRAVIRGPPGERFKSTDIVEKLEFLPRSQFRRPLAGSREISLGAQALLWQLPFETTPCARKRDFRCNSISVFFNNIDPLLPLKISHMNGREPRESGLRGNPGLRTNGVR